MSPPKHKRAPGKSALQNAELIRAYRLLTFLQTPFGFVFWLIEQRKARIQDKLEQKEVLK